MTAVLNIALAQLAVTAGDVPANRARHVVAARQAAAAGAQAVFFAELSLTGYEPTLAADLAFLPDDVRLQPLRQLAKELQITLVVGAPLRHEQAATPYIAAWWITPDGQAQIQTKQYLHSGEEVAFAPGAVPAPLILGEHTVALAICADATYPAHPAYAAQWQPAIYIASSMISAGGYAKDSAELQGHAVRHGMPVALVNHGAPTGGWQAAGRSALWDETGTLVAATPGAGDYLLLLRRDADWQGVAQVLTV